MDDELFQDAEVQQQIYSCKSIKDVMIKLRTEDLFSEHFKEVID